MPFCAGGCIGSTALKPGDVSFPFRLTWQSGKTRHVTLPVEIINGVANHEKLPVKAIDFHGNNTDLMLPLDDFRPNMAVNFKVLGNKCFVIDKGKCLAITFHSLWCSLNNLQK